MQNQSVRNIGKTPSTHLILESKDGTKSRKKSRFENERGFRARLSVISIKKKKKVLIMFLHMSLLSIYNGKRKKEKKRFARFFLKRQER